MSNPDNDVAGQMENVSYNAGYIVLSHLVSFVGSATTLELLHRRTSRAGLYNWYLLVTSSITMGGIGIWCMHFIGNRAIIMSDGESAAQISYSSGFTAISFFLPIGVLLGAFYFIGVTEKPNRYYVGLAGTLTGIAVCGMHYVGQLGIANYNCSYHVQNVVGAAVIAVFASLVALSVFFRLRAAWTNSWWKRGFCASILAAAVSGMHWTATVGTFYMFKGRQFASRNQLSRTQTVIVCTVLSCASCILLFIFAAIGNRQRKRSANRAQQLVLACAFFDQSGRVMVTPEGFLPNHKITNHYIERTFGDDEFSKTHPAFIWVFRATRNWKALRDLIPGMKDHLVSNESSKRYCPGNGTTIDDGAELDMDFDLVFKELFCVAAQELAEEIHQPLDKMGVLYEDVVATGTHGTISYGKTTLFHRKPTASVLDLENADLPYVFGRGQFVFVVRELTKPESTRMPATGFRFAAIPQIAEPLSRSMLVSREDMLLRLQNMRDYSTNEKLMEPGVHVTCFAIRPTVRKGFDVLVSSNARNQLPSTTLPIDHLQQWQVEILRRMDEWTVAGMLKWLKGDTGYQMPYEQNFCKQLYGAISKLAEDIEDPCVMDAKFSARRILAPCRSNPRSYTPGKCTILSLRIITSLHARASNNRLTFVPLRFFNAQQQVYTGVADHEVFARQIHREFAHCNDRRDAKSTSSRLSSRLGTPPESPMSSVWPLSDTGRASDGSKSPTSAEKSLVANPAFGGIMVSNQISVDVSELTNVESESSIELHEMGTTAEVGIAAMEIETYVDELYALCRL